MLDKVDSAGRVTLLPETTFLHINRAMICINASNFFFGFFKNWPVNMNAMFDVLILDGHFDRWWAVIELFNMIW